MTPVRGRIDRPGHCPLHEEWVHLRMRRNSSSLNLCLVATHERWPRRRASKKNRIIIITITTMHEPCDDGPHMARPKGRRRDEEEEKRLINEALNQLWRCRSTPTSWRRKLSYVVTITFAIGCQVNRGLCITFEHNEVVCMQNKIRCFMIGMITGTSVGRIIT